MKHIVLLLLVHMLCSQAVAKVVNAPNRLKSIIIVNDTIFVDNTPYGLFKSTDGAYTFSTLDISEIMYIQPFTRNNKEYYKVSFSPLKQVYFAEKKAGTIKHIVDNAIKNGVVEDGYFSAYGTNMLTKELLRSKVFMTPAELPELKTPDDILAQKIRWEETDNEDSTLIISGNNKLAYFKKRHWREYGIRRRHVRVSTESTYRYFIYSTSDDSPLAEVRVADWWQTEVTIISPDGWTYKFKNVPKTDDLMRVAAKLVLYREALKQ